MTMQHPDSESKSFLSSGWVVVLLMALSAAVGQAFGRFSYGVLLPAVRDDMGISNTLAGFIGGANVGAYLVGTLLVSWIAGRYRLLAIMRLGLLMVVAGLFGAAFSATPLALASALGLAGVGGAMLRRLIRCRIVACSRHRLLQRRGHGYARGCLALWLLPLRPTRRRRELG